MNRKGQALVEFVLILPVFILILFAIVDFDTDLDITMKEDNQYTDITITENVKVITPGLNLILGNPYKITVERVIPNANT